MTGLNWVSLGELAELRAGVGFPIALQGKPSGDYPFAKVGDVSRCARSGGVYLSAADHYLDLDEVSSLRAQPIPKGSILFAKIGEAIRQNYRVISGCDLLVDNNVMAVVPNDQVFGKYLFHYLKTLDFYRLAPSTTVPALRKSDLQKVLIPMVSICDQKRIAKILDDVETLLGNRRRTLIELENISRSLFFDMFGELGGASSSCPVVSLVELVSPDRPISYGILMPGPHQADGVSYIRVVDMKDGGVDAGSVRKTSHSISSAFKRSLLREGDILMSIRGHVGRLASVPAQLEGANITQDTARLAIDESKAVPVFIREYLRTVKVQRWMAKHVKGVAVRGINLTDVKRIPIAVPCMELQKEFACKINLIESLVSPVRSQITQLNTLLASIQHRAFRGEL